jgi:formate dehydrogenase iron-sulfur subunit
MSAWGILTDVTKCIGCEECVAACKRTNHTGEDEPQRWQGSPEDLSSTRWTTLATAPKGRSVRVHCRHCLEPACASACPVGALRRTPVGAVAYDPNICMGCRYCMIACPFRMTRYEWESATPRVRKCILCYDRIRRGEIKEPACTAACPTKATVFGDRDALLADARRRMVDEPGRYIHHVWGEHEVGGTSVLYISDVDLSTAGWPSSLRDASYPALTRPAMHAVPPAFLGVGAMMFGLSWVIGRRDRLAREGEEEKPESTGSDEPRKVEP